jgi:GNAT superfamily N-acetyltransferase
MAQYSPRSWLSCVSSSAARRRARSSRFLYAWVQELDPPVHADQEDRRLPWHDQGAVVNGQADIRKVTAANLIDEAVTRGLPYRAPGEPVRVPRVVAASRRCRRGTLNSRVARGSDEDALWLEHFYLAEEAQGRGVGTAVLSTVLSPHDLSSYDWIHDLRGDISSLGFTRVTASDPRHRKRSLS